MIQKFQKIISRKRLFIYIFLIIISCFGYNSIAKAIKYENSNNNEKISLKNDIQEIKLLKSQTKNVINYIENTPELFMKNMAKDKVFSYQDKLEIWRTWILFSEYITRLDIIGHKYDYLYKNSKGKTKREAFIISFTSFLIQYRYSMEFIKAIDKNESLYAILNEGNNELALTKDTYSDFKFRFLNVVRATEFVRLDMIYQFYNKKEKLFANEIKKDSRWLYKTGIGKGSSETIENGLQIIQNTFMTAWYPMKEKTLLIGTVKINRLNKNLITNKQINILQKNLRPGDIILERKEWYLSNLGIPGFWTHTALYIGTTEERENYFNDKQVIDWVKSQNEKAKNFNDLIKIKYPKKYKKSNNKLDNHSINFIESIAEGVTLNTLQRSAKADSLAILRPRLSKLEKAKAILIAFKYVGKPYDYDFNLESDNKLVCSELIYKSYENSLNFPISTVIGKKVLAPNDLARIFDKNFDTKEQQFNFILFLDGIESKEKSEFANINEFRKSWKRPKWHNVLR